MHISNNLTFSHFHSCAKNLDFSAVKSNPALNLHVKNHAKPKGIKKWKRPIVLGCALLGMFAGLKLVGKRQDINILKLENYKKIDYNPATVITIAGCSILGGVSSGITLDEKNKRTKLREGFQQMIGNILFPVLTITQGKKMLHNLVDKIKMPQIKSDKKIVQNLNYALRQLPNAVVAAGLLIGGLFAGNKVANFINNLIFEKNENRKFKISDLSCHVDDACLAATMVTKGTGIGSKIAAVIPPALVIPGYIAGTKTSNDKH